MELQKTNISPKVCNGGVHRVVNMFHYKEMATKYVKIPKLNDFNVRFQ